MDQLCPRDLAILGFLAIAVFLILLAIYLKNGKYCLPGFISLSHKVVNSGQNDSWIYFICNTIDEPTNLYNLLLVMFTALLALVAVFQFHSLEASNEIATMSAHAATNAAEAALKALDRPWLFINQPLHTRDAWISGRSGLSAIITVTNHGKAPAIVERFAAQLFVNFNGSITASDGDEQFHIPPKERLNFFLENECPTLRQLPFTVMFRSQTDNSQWLTEECAAFLPPVVVGPGETCPRFAINGPLPFQGQSNDVHLNEVKNIYLVGMIKYSWPNLEHETVNFCYKCPPRGLFAIYLDAPYNERSSQAL